MNKYFKNKNPITVEKLLETYKNFYWGDHPDYGCNKRACLSLIDECQESDAYNDYRKQTQ
jgi:hypothetical protein